MPAFIAADLEFQLSVARAGHNELLEQFYQLVQKLLVEIVDELIRRPHVVAESLPLQEAVVAAIQKRILQLPNRQLRRTWPISPNCLINMSRRQPRIYKENRLMKASNSFAYLSPQFSVLSESQLKDLHLATLETMRQTGIRFHHTGALDLLKQAGAFISDGNLVKFSARMVEESLASAPERIVMCDRDGNPTVFLEGSRTYFGTGLDCLNFLDPTTGEHRPFIRKDIRDSYRLVDALPNIHFLMSMGIPSDVDSALGKRCGNSWPALEPACKRHLERL